MCFIIFFCFILLNKMRLFTKGLFSIESIRRYMYIVNSGSTEISSISGKYTNVCRARRKNITRYLAKAIWQVVCPILGYYIIASDPDSTLVRNHSLFHIFLYFHGIYYLHMRVKCCTGMHTNVGLRTKQFRFMSER